MTRFNSIRVRIRFREAASGPDACTDVGPAGARDGGRVAPASALRSARVADRGAVRDCGERRPTRRLPGAAPGARSVRRSIFAVSQTGSPQSAQSPHSTPTPRTGRRRAPPTRRRCRSVIQRDRARDACAVGSLKRARSAYASLRRRVVVRGRKPLWLSAKRSPPPSLSA